jgi:hypothetical protein
VPQQLEMDKMQFELPPSHGVPAESQDSVGKKSDHVPGPPSPQLVS